MDCKIALWVTVSQPEYILQPPLKFRFGFVIFQSMITLSGPRVGNM